jgi:SAM-dependent methyltransferase
MPGGARVSSASARVSRARPFNADYAEAYNLLVTDPVEPWAEAVHDRLLAGGWPSAAVLDAGCGTGRHAAALAAKGHHVDLADTSERLLAQAASRNPSALALHADLCALAVSRKYQAVTCRGVLNDMTTDAERDAALQGLRRALSGSGVLMLDAESLKVLAGGRTECPGTGPLTSGHAVACSSPAPLHGRLACCTSLRTTRCARLIRPPTIAGSTSSCGRGARRRPVNA